MISNGKIRNRKIAGVLMEQSLGNCVHRIYDLVEEWKRTKTGQKKIKPLIEKYYPGRYTDLTVDEFIDLHNSKPIEEVYYLEVGCFSDFTPEIVEKWMDELGVESQSEILMPESEVADLGELKEVLSPEEYEKVRSGMTGKFVPVQKKLQCGWMTLEELYHIPSYSNKVTTSMYGVDVSSKRDEPILGKVGIDRLDRRLVRMNCLHCCLETHGNSLPVREKTLRRKIINCSLIICLPWDLRLVTKRDSIKEVLV